MAQHVTVVEYDDSWKRMFKTERELIRSIMGSTCIASYHIGSTSVPGLSAKPVIDILVAARSLEEADGCREAFENAGYEWMGEFGIPGRRYLRKGGDERPIRSTSSAATTGSRSTGTLHSGTTFARTRMKASSIPDLRRSLQSAFHTTSKDTATGRTAS